MLNKYDKCSSYKEVWSEINEVNQLQLQIQIQIHMKWEKKGEVRSENKSNKKQNTNQFKCPVNLQSNWEGN